MPTGSPVLVNPAGTEIAGFDMNVTYQHDRIQSIYVIICVPAISVGYAIVTSNGATCVTGRTKYSKRSNSSAAWLNICDWRALALATSAADCRSASAISHLIVSLIHSGRCLASAA